MAKFKIFRRGHERIEDTLHFESVHRDARDRYDLTFQNISDTADLRRIHISVLDVEIPFVPTAETPSWISVKEKVPEYGKRVLLYMKAPAWGDKQIHIGCRTNTDASGDHWNVDYGHYISHWMPLPELPREYIDMQVASLSVPDLSCKGPDGGELERGE
jgi:hypothetical protein